MLRTLFLYASLAAWFSACFVFPVHSDGTTLLAQQATPQQAQWETVETVGQPTARHEASLVAFKEKLYLIGGRRVNPVDVYDPATNTWTAKSKTPIELHHFQAVVHGDAIYLIGAMTGGWPNETPLEKVVVYYPETDKFEFVHNIPPSRRRGGAGAVVHKDKIYIVGGITNGHMDGYQRWLDEYDPKSGKWTPLADAPHARDHFQAAIVGDRLYAFAGRTTSQKTKQGFDLTVADCDAYDFATSKWLTDKLPPIPTPRAGNMAIGTNNKIIIGGGESGTQVPAHDQVEIFDTQSEKWTSAAKLNRGRHGSGFAIIGNSLYTASGCGNRGGEPELTSLERILLDNLLAQPQVKPKSISQYHPVSLSFTGPDTSETATPNPFTDYRLRVTFTHKKSGTTRTVRGFYAADGKSGSTHADSGNQWQALFAPALSGEWTWKATLRTAPMIAINRQPEAGQEIMLAMDSGAFVVVANEQKTTDFRTRGHIVVENQRFKFFGTDDYWLKGGADSPENLLGYEGFDNTYRMAVSDEEGEAKADKQLHRFEAHFRDWTDTDPSWPGTDGKPKGQSLIGAFNYLASKGINSAYFLTNNVRGDGKDVWPWLKPDDFTRFDCSKLAQWEIVFDHMQRKGIAMHVQLQETENETMLDGGNTGSNRKLYFQELISRFAHHPALVWNLGEENGPAEWTPVGQTPAQRIAMADYIKSVDPYNHPVVMHTHADPHSKVELLTPLLGKKSIDGLSFQVDKRETVHAEIANWFAKSKAAAHPWLISMDELGMWHTGVQTDAEDPDHDTVRRYALWGSLLAGSAGVEWYFGAKSPHNDLTCEDWRTRDRMWDLTRIATRFFEQHLPWWEMQAADDLVTTPDSYCFAKPGTIYAVYFHRTDDALIDLQDNDGSFTVRWYNPLDGGQLQTGSIQTITGPGPRSLGTPPPTESPQDWVALVTRQK